MGIPIPGGFADVQEGFEPIPAGTYAATVFEGEVKEAGPEAKHPGSQYIAWTFKIQEEPYVGRQAWLNSSLVDKALPMLKRFLKAVGYTDDQLNTPEFELDLDDVKGRECRIVLTVGTNPRTDEPNNSIKRVLPPGEGGETELP